MLMHVPAPSIACHSGFGLAEIGALSDDGRAGFTPWLPVLHLLGFVPAVATSIILAPVPTIQVYREYFDLVSGLGFAPSRLPVVHGGGAYTEHVPELRLREASCVEACPSHHVPPYGRVVVHHSNPSMTPCRIRQQSGIGISPDSPPSRGAFKSTCSIRARSCKMFAYAPIAYNWLSRSWKEHAGMKSNVPSA